MSTREETKGGLRGLNGGSGRYYERMRGWANNPAIRGKFEFKGEIFTSHKGKNLMFNSISWGRKKHLYKGRDDYDFDAWRADYNTRRYYLVDDSSVGLAVTQRITAPLQTPYTGCGGVPGSRHTVPPLCCDDDRTSLCFVPHDIPLRAVSTSFLDDFVQDFDRIILTPTYWERGQPVFTAYSAEWGENADIDFTAHPAFKIRGYFHEGATSTFGAADSSLRQDLRFISQTVATFSPVWNVVKSYIPLNELLVLSSFMTDDNADDYFARGSCTHTPTRGVSVTTVSSRVIGSMDTTPGPTHHQSLWRELVDLRATKAFQMSHAYHQFDRHRLEFDLMNFCNRHVHRVQSLWEMNINLINTIMDRIMADMELMRTSPYIAVKNSVPAVQEEAKQLHTSDHQRYLDAWIALKAILSMVVDQIAPRLDACKSLLALLDSICAYYEVHGGVRRIIRRVAEGDCCASSLLDVNLNVGLNSTFTSTEGGEGGIHHGLTSVRLMCWHVANGITLDLECMTMVWDTVVTFSYQSLDCPSRVWHGPETDMAWAYGVELPGDSHPCGSVGECVGCECDMREMGKAKECSMEVDGLLYRYACNELVVRYAHTHNDIEFKKDDNKERGQWVHDVLWPRVKAVIDRDRERQTDDHESTTGVCMAMTEELMEQVMKCYEKERNSRRLGWSFLNSFEFLFD